MQKIRIFGLKDNFFLSITLTILKQSITYFILHFLVIVNLKVISKKFLNLLSLF